ncbi:MAG: ribonuclease P protein component [Chloroflexi bacterium]|nr:ribonuclease P protein component [Chloroflexota bacterium]
MRKDQSLRKTKDFAAVRREGRSWPDRLLVLAARRNGLEVSRFGFTVGKRVGNAVVRNKIKRRLKEAVPLNQVQQGWDIVLIARKDASSAEYHRLKRSMTGLLKRAGVLVVPPTQTCSREVE